MPIKVLDIDISAGLASVRIEEKYDRAFAIVRKNGNFVGCAQLWVRPPWITSEELRCAIWEQLGDEVVRSSLVLNSVETSAPAPKINVVVCTRNRADALKGCLKAIQSITYPNFETIVVDNAPTDQSSQAVCAEFEVQYVREPKPGLDHARNRGIAHAEGEIIAFIDDDARPDARWLNYLAKAFSDPTVSAVTGFVAPLELETDAQIHFELDYGGMAHGCRRRRIMREDLPDSGLLWASSFGVGTNMAFRKAVFDEIGTFDLALDVGTPSGGGGDIEMFHRLVARGFTLVYEPSAIVWHTHRRDKLSFARQLYQNGTGFGSYLITCARNRTVARTSALKFAIRTWLGGWILKRLMRAGSLPRRYVLQELRGALASPFAYRRSRTIVASFEN